VRWSSVVAGLLAAGTAAGCGSPEAGAPAPPTSSSGVPVPGAAGDPCEGLVQDRNNRPLAALAKPAPGAAVRDPAFGGMIRRITGVSPAEGSNAAIVPMYGTIQAWNADESRLILWHRGRGHELYDGRSYQFLRALGDVSANDMALILWDPVDPDLFYYPTGADTLMRYRVSAARGEVARRFEFCVGSRLTLGDDPMYSSWGPQGRVLGLQCGRENFLYDVGADRVLARAALGTDTAPQPGPSGRLAFQDGVVLDASFNRVRTLAVGNGREHASLGRSAATGHDTLNAVAFVPPRGGTEAADVGTLVTHDMETGERRVVIGIATGYPYPPGGTHISAIATRRPGWVAVSVVGDFRVRRVLDSELVLANTDTGQVCRVAHHRSRAGDGRFGYFAEPHVVISPSGTRMLFGSDWEGGDSVDSYVVELPGYR
jgi:hypothetical protein